MQPPANRLPQLAAALLLLSSCALGPDAGSSGSDGRKDVNPADRKILGVPDPYPADPGLRARQAELDGSMQARREVGWATLAKVLQPVALAESGIQPADPDAVPSVPRFQTWYGKDDYVRMWKQLYKQLGRDGRRARQAFAPDALDGIFGWNAHMVDQLPSWPADRYQQYVAKLKTAEEWNGEGAGHRVTYSPAVMRHFFANWARVNDCVALLAGISPTAPPATPDNFTACFDAELPIDAVVVKAQWVRAEFGARVPTYDTSPDRIARRMAPDSDGAWNNGDGDGDGTADPGPERIHTVKLSSGNVFRLVGMHVMVKELRKWLWITLWWSDAPDADFGADRPELPGLPSVWRNYKMCVVTSADDGAAPSWCSNPYLEKGAGNARSNCIGCHQHAGTTLTAEQILAGADNGRREIRTNFPTDYLWAFDRTDNLSRVITDEVQYYDSFEK